MDKEDIVKFCAEFWQVEPSVFDSELALNDKNLPNNSSIRYYQFLARIESHFNVRINEINNIITFGDLFKDLLKEQ